MQANSPEGNGNRLTNVTFPQARIDINDNFEALQTLNSGNSEPSTKAAFMQWLDTSTDPAVLKIRNSSNNGWIEVGSLSASQYAAKGLTAIANGGTGATTAAAAIAALLPAQANNSGKNLTTNGSVLSWAETISSSFTRLDYTDGSTQAWTKPSTGTIVVILCWGGGGGGGKDGHSDEGAGGGGGGACGILIKPFSELTDSIYTVTVGAGGAGRTSGNGSGSNGGNSTVSGVNDGVIVTGYGGEGGKQGSSSYNAGRGGNGGGNTKNGSAYGDSRIEAMSDGSGHGAYAITNSPTVLLNNEDVDYAGFSITPAGSLTFGGGGGGSARKNGTIFNYGGSSVFGGGGGGGSNEDGDSTRALGGTSVLGGNGGRGGGDDGGAPAAGSVPGGGGGCDDNNGKAGGNGRVEFYVF